MSAEKAWSLLDNRPVLKYVSNCDDYIVYWNGIVMPHKMALCIAGRLIGVYPTPEMKIVMQQNYLKLYYANAFGSLGKWDHLVTNRQMYNVVENHMMNHLNELQQQNIPGAEVLGWFDYNRVAID
jgi:hypothetical protein